MHRKEISVVVPCYNEGKNIKDTILELMVYLNTNFGGNYEIVAVNDGSKDDTSNILMELRETIPQLKVVDYGQNMGKGFAVRKGMFTAKGRYICFTDADLSTPCEEIKRAIEIMREKDIDVLIGSRSIKESNIEKKQPFYRVFMGRVFSFLANSIVPLGGIVDTQCGFKCFTYDATKNIFSVQRMKGFSFDVEILYIARLRNYKIYEMPVTWINDEDSKVNPIVDSLKMFIDLWKIRQIHKKTRS